MLHRDRAGIKRGGIAGLPVQRRHHQLLMPIMRCRRGGSVLGESAQDRHLVGNAIIRGTKSMVARLPIASAAGALREPPGVSNGVARLRKRFR